MSISKAKRLKELKDEDKFFKTLDKYFDAGWREFVKNIDKKNDISNVRMFKILSVIKGNDFIADLMQLMGNKNKSALLMLTKKPKGILINDSRFKTIPNVIINKYTACAYAEGEIFIKVTFDRYVYFVF